MQQMDIYGVSFDLVRKQPIVLLKTAEGNKFLPIWIGHPEAAAILMRIQGASTPRPMTHDLLTDMLLKLDAEDAPPENVSTMTPEQQAQLRDQFKEFLENVTPDQFAAAADDED